MHSVQASAVARDSAWLQCQQLEVSSVGESTPEDADTRVQPWAGCSTMCSSSPPPEHSHAAAPSVPEQCTTIKRGRTC